MSRRTGDREPVVNELRHEGMMARLWAGWRIPYIEADDDERAADVKPGLTLFESILRSELPDEVTYILWRGEHCFAMLNAFPYSSGHLMVMPQRGVAELEGLTSDEHRELFEGVRQAVIALKAAFRPQGVNVGINLGEASGAGFPDHLHVHCLPRWRGDTNFMTSIAEARVLPESLRDTWRKLKTAWPA